ncbi:Uncharacterized membrane protein HdeD, DUF308 family [Rhizobiales bacterium GAS191]|nr:Uncharacterized membrane protein HdeD, DUF308 family [Rhizobiales bacterium GAS191]SED19962.1 Uncharacterized membrane protein HdeD, DUF308 family [Rhizobiales bacterium GAS188]
MAPVELPQTAAAAGPPPHSPPPHSLGSSIAHLRERWGWFAALGVAFILFGAIAFGSLVAATVATVLVNGIMMVLGGVAEIAIGLHMKTWSRLVLLCAAGALLVIGGILCYFNPVLASIVLTLFLGAALCAAGMVRIYVASQMGADTPWRIAILSGLVTFFLGVIILAKWPVDSLYVLGLFLAIDLVFYGTALLGLAFQLRTHHQHD